MSGFWNSYLGRLRREVGDRLILMPGARIVIEDGQGRILLQERADFGLWGLPGGHAEDGEDLTDMIVRETLEETGLIIASPTPYGFSFRSGARNHRLPQRPCGALVRDDVFHPRFRRRSAGGGR